MKAGIVALIVLAVVFGPAATAQTITHDDIVEMLEDHEATPNAHGRELTDAVDELGQSVESLGDEVAELRNVPQSLAETIADAMPAFAESMVDTVAWIGISIVVVLVGAAVLLFSALWRLGRISETPEPGSGPDRTNTEPEGAKGMFNDLEPTDSLGRLGESVSYVTRARSNGKFIIRIRATNHKILLESDNEYDTLEEAEEKLAQIYDETIKGNTRRVRKPVEDEEDDQD